MTARAPVVSQDTQYTVVLHIRYSVMWCLRYGVYCVVVLCVCVCFYLCYHWGCIEVVVVVVVGGYPATRVSLLANARSTFVLFFQALQHANGSA